MKEIDSILSKYGVVPTPVRKLIYKCLKNAEGALSLSDLETRLDTVDKSTISRSLATFKDHHLIHSFTDGSGSMKYELCVSPDMDSHSDYHVHFRCEKCGATICLQDVNIPPVDLPSDFISHEVSYIVAGICGGCNQNKEK